MSKRKKYTGKRGTGSLADALKSAPSLSAFTFDGPYEASRLDLLDNMSCADNGRYYDTPMDWNALLAPRVVHHGTSRPCILSVMP